MSPTLEVKDLIWVRAVAKSGGVSRAARALHVSQSAVSHHLARLEERLGVPLFERVGRKLQIVAAGRRVVALADELLPRLTAVETELREPKARVLRLATQCYTAYHWLPDITESLSEHHPHVELRIRVEATRDPLDALERGKLDLAFIHAAPPKRGFVHRRLAEDQLMLVMAPSHPLAARDKVKPADLRPHRFFVFDSTGPELLAQSRRTFAEGDAPPRVQRVPLTDVLIQLVRSGQGVSLLSRWIVGPSLDRGELVSRPLTKARLRRTWRAVYRSDSGVGDAIETVIGDLARSLAFG